MAIVALYFTALVILGSILLAKAILLMLDITAFVVSELFGKK